MNVQAIAASIKASIIRPLWPGPCGGTGGRLAAQRHDEIKGNILGGEGRNAMATPPEPPNSDGRWHCPRCDFSCEATDDEDREKHLAEHFDEANEKSN